MSLRRWPRQPTVDEYMDEFARTLRMAYARRLCGLPLLTGVRPRLESYILGARWAP